MRDILSAITAYREERRWTEYQLAERSGLPQSTISSWYRKNMVPTIPSLEKICTAFGITLSQLFAEGDSAVALTASQKALLERFSRLSKDQQTVIFQLIDNSSDGNGANSSKDFDLTEVRKSVKAMISDAQIGEDHRFLMNYYTDTTEHIRDDAASSPFAYLPRKDAVIYNPMHPAYNDFDHSIAELHEVSHRSDYLYYRSFENKGFVEVIDTESRAAMSKIDEINALFAEGGVFHGNYYAADIYSALTDDCATLPAGHNAEYWKKQGMKETEIYANLNILQIIDPKTVVHLENRQPDVVRIFKEIIKSDG